jgi:hypothetical protein
MSEAITGRVAKITTKNGTGRKGPWTLYSIRLTLDNGAEYPNWVSAGFDRPKFNEGDYISAVIDTNEKGYKNLSGWCAAAAPAAEATAAPAKSYGEAKNQSIHYQSARKDALQVVGLLIANAALPLSAAKTASGTAKRYDEVMALVDKLTVRYYTDTETLRVLDMVDDEGEEDVSPAPESTDEED